MLSMLALCGGDKPAYTRMLLQASIVFRLDVPGMDPHVLVFDPAYAETVYRNEGPQPIRFVIRTESSHFR